MSNQDEQKYLLTLDHVRQFLATKGDNDPLGICHNSMYCLLSETLNWLYPDVAPWRVDMGSYSSAGADAINLDRQLGWLRMAFDADHFDLIMCLRGGERIVTKARLKARLEKIAAKLPFAVTDLFPEENSKNEKLESNERE